MSNRQYKVVGSAKVLDNEPGATFSHDFSDDEENALLASGAILPVKDAPPKSEIQASVDGD